MERQSEKYDFYDLKGLVEFVLESFQIEVNWEPGDFPTFHPGRQAQVKIGEQVVVRLEKFIQLFYKITILINDICI